MASRFRNSSRALVLILSGTLACGGDLLLPDPPPGGSDAVQLAKVNGDKQVGVVGEPLQTPLVLSVMTTSQVPAIGREVEFVFTSAAGEVTPAKAVTNSAGQATAQWVLGPAPGPQSVAARLVVVGAADAQTQEFTAEAKPAAPDAISAKSPTSQPGRRGQKVGTQPVVQVVDRFGNPVPDIPVAWQVTTGHGDVSEASSNTKADGTATVEWTLGNRVGVQRLTATVGAITGSPVSFTATVLF